MSRIKTVKYFSGKVAAVYGVTSPVATCICLKLIQQGASVILLEEEETESVASLSRDLNLLFGGINTNDQDGVQSWRTRPIVTHLCVSGGQEQDRRIANFSLGWFGKLPELLIDVSSVLKPIDVDHLIFGKAQNISVGIQPLNCACLWSTGWLGSIPCGELDPLESFWEDIVVYTTASYDLIQDLVKNEKTDFQLSDSEGIWLMKTDDLILVLAYFLHGGLYITAEDLKTHMETKSHLLVCSHYPRVKIEELELNTLLKNSKKDYINYQSPDPGIMKTGLDDVKDSEVWRDDHELIEEDGSITSGSELVRTRTFDALLQKTKDYPVDWWQGGCERFVSVDDINCKGLATAAMNFAVRWAVLGYFVVGFAVPKVFGWTVL